MNTNSVEMRTWKDLLGRYFPSKIKTRGNSYAEKGYVSLKQSQSDRIKAVVEGHISYSVEIIAEQNATQFKVFCSCPYFRKGNSCKHLWAAIVAADEAMLQNYTTPTSTQSAKSKVSPNDWNSIINPPKNTPPDKTSEYMGQAKTFALYYELNLSRGIITLKPYQQYIKKDQSPGRRKEINQNVLSDPSLPHGDKIILNNLVNKFASEKKSIDSINRGSILKQEEVAFLLPYLAETERCLFLEDKELIANPLQKGNPFVCNTKFIPEDKKKNKKKITFSSYINFPDNNHFLVPFGEIKLFLGNSPFFFIYQGKLYKLDDLTWEQLRRLEQSNYKFYVAKKEIKEFVQSLDQSFSQEQVQLPSDLALEEHTNISPVPVLQISISNTGLEGETYFDYNGLLVAVQDERPRILDTENWQYINRDLEQEKQCLQFLLDTGFTFDKGSYHHPLQGGTEAIQRLVQNNWHVEGKDKKRINSGFPSSMRISSGQDWFDLEADIDFENSSIPLPRAIRAFLQGYKTVTLDDGSVGMLPLDWLEKNIQELSLGLETKQKQDPESEEKLHYHPGQALALDQLISEQEQMDLNEHFIQIRDELKNFQGVQPKEAPANFQGELRQYQKEALGWLEFLQKFQFGGILADDMGLGKTIQVLAWLKYRKTEGTNSPSLVVAPTSLVLNWEDEAKRFLPDLKVLTYIGPSRKKYLNSWDTYDLIVTSYGILRLDVEYLAEKHVDYYILDESQAIKNYSSKTFKAAKALKAENKLCLTGTPLENHLGELWSQMDFLNPGILNSAKKFEESYVKPLKQGDENSRDSLNKLIKPFILRRCKEEVESELPEKMEQVIKCPMSSEQQELYQRLRDHYRDSILSAVDQEGLNKNKMKVLEGLLRLRQSACHPGMIDPEHLDSGKMEKLRELLEEVKQGNHKALVFSQFTKFLKLLSQDLDKNGFSYLYLDGSTPNHKRKKQVEHFQSGSNPNLFLISLKAGGTGLNLTAADYVFILDPWWNPAVEMQAVDRTHRIGQDKKVFTFRLITRDSVEEKVQALQEQKKELVQSVLSGSKDMLKQLSREDLEVLFS